MTTTGYDYIENVPQFYIDEVMRILIEIQPNFQRLWYLLDTLSCRLFGKNFLQTFSIWTGIGANGKSLLGNLLDNAFGKYYAKLSSDTITKESKSANSTSEFSRVSSCLTLLFEEPAENTKLQTAILKEHSGDAKVRTRGLFQESYEYTPQYGMIICCNEIPELSKIGGHAITRRLRIINFPTKFCENPTKPHERVCDKNLNEKITNDNNYRNAFIKILIDNWIKKDLKTNFLTPECILEDSKEYLDNCNHIKSFLEEKYDYLEYTAENKAKIKSSELFSDFKYYLAANKIDIKVTDKTFKVFVEAEGFQAKRTKSGVHYYDIKKREELEDE
jgi:phage/plasmid-associated DNA primase